MSQKDRQRHKRRQKREERHKKRRAQVPRRAAREPDVAEIRREAMGYLIEDCRALLTRESRFTDKLRAEIREFGACLGGVWARLVLELEDFLYEGKPWELRCEDLHPLRRHFQDFDAKPVFDRIWMLCLTHDRALASPGAAFPDPGQEPWSTDPAGRMALAFWRLHAGLDAPGEDRRSALKTIREGVRMIAGPKTACAFHDLLNLALSSLLPPGRGRKPALPREIRLARDAEAFIRAHGHEHEEAGFWVSTLTLLREVVRRHLGLCGTAWLRDYPDLLEALYGAPILALTRPPAEIQGSLQAIRPDRAAERWLGFLAERIDPEALGFEPRLRYELARGKLLFARARTVPTDFSGSERRDLTQAFERIFGLLGRGVPPEARHLPPVLEPIVLDYYVEACRSLKIFRANLGLSEALLRRHPDDHRLACLHVTGALESRHRITVEARGDGARPWAHVEPELFAECADVWRSVSAEDQARPILYVPLAREQKKQCLLALTRHRLRTLSIPAAIRDALDGLADYLGPDYRGPDGFVYETLSHGAALERELVFLGALTAAWRGLPLPVLSYAAFVQFAGYAGGLCTELSSVEGLIVEFLERHPDRWYTPAEGWQRLEALSEALPERPFRALKPALKRLVTGLPRTPRDSAAHQRLLQRLGIGVQDSQRLGPGVWAKATDTSRPKTPPEKVLPKKARRPKKTRRQRELFDDLAP